MGPREDKHKVDRDVTTGSSRSDTTYHEFEACPSVQPHVLSYWHVAANASYPTGELHPVWPDGCTSVVAIHGSRFSGIRLIGPRVDPLHVSLTAGDQIWGIRFWPDRGSAILGVPGRTLTNVETMADQFFTPQVLFSLVSATTKTDSAAQMGRRFDDWIAPLIEISPPIDSPIRGAVVALMESDGRIDLGQLAEISGLSIRHLQRRFGDRVGLTPKQFGRIRRIRTAFAKLLETPQERWGSIAAELRYADQAHLIRDVTKMTGLTPTDVRTRIQRIHHVNVTP